MRVHCLLLPLALAATVAPASADMFKPGVKDQIALGKRAAEQIRKEEKVLKEDDARVSEVRRIGAKLVGLIPDAERKKKPFEYSFDVIDNKELNAFAMPGGPMFIYTGLLDKMTTEDQIAGVMAHELTHVRKEHWASAYADNQKRKLGLLVVLSVLNANDTVFNAAAVSDALLFELPYSRKNEQQADDIGYQLASQAGYNPQGMVDTFEILIKNSGGGGGKGTEWASDHPALQKRIDTIKKRMQKSSTTFPAQKPRATG